MKKLTAGLKNIDWFFLTLVSFSAILPFSQALVSIFSGVLLFVALATGTWKSNLLQLKKNRILLFLPAIYLIYLFSAVISGDVSQSTYDLRKTLFFIVLPLAFVFGNDLSASQKRLLFIVFTLAVFISTLTAFARLKIFPSSAGFEVHKITLISHIRFSFQLILAFWFYVLLIYNNYRNLTRSNFIFYSLVALYFVSFLFFQQSLTGLFGFIISVLFFLFYLAFQTQKEKKRLILVFAFLLIIVPVSYVSWVVYDFYDIEEVDESSIDRQTALGNPYSHHFENPMVENGRYVHLYVCEKEMREEWNKRSEIKYDSNGLNGYPVRATLLRYLTSKGLRKDAEGVRALNDHDIRNVEKGIANYIFAGNKFSLYPRIYQTVWEYYVYTKTGYANHQSFSQRIEFARAAVTIIKQNFWFGVGTAHYEQAFEDAYILNQSKLDKELYATSHNQYLNYMVKFGFTGLLAILFFLVFPVVKTKRFRDVFFLLFLVFMFFANVGDSNFESHMGSSFFVFFYCVFLTTNGMDYLRISGKKPLFPANVKK